MSLENSPATKELRRKLQQVVVMFIEACDLLCK
jgi:hypothetical protein